MNTRQPLNIHSRNKKVSVTLTEIFLALVVCWTRGKEIIGPVRTAECLFLAVPLCPPPLGDLVVLCTTRERNGSQWDTMHLLFNQTTEETRIGFLVCYFLAVLSVEWLSGWLLCK